MQFDLVFEGGGAKGVAFVGAIQEFEARGHTAMRFVGTSAAFRQRDMGQRILI